VSVWEEVEKMAGRPAKRIDKQEFERLMAIGCDKQEVLGWFDLKLNGLNESTFDKWLKREYGCNFSELATKRLPVVKLRVRKSIMDMLGKNAAVTIFAAKNVLGWTDKMEQTVNDASHMSLDVNLIKSKLKDGDSNAD
jgi:hypothetical protein